MQFKYSEEDIFNRINHNYYFPSLNIKYPKTIGGSFRNSELFASGNSGDLINMFNEFEYFIIDPIDQDIIKQNIGLVDINLEYDNVDVERVYEQYTEFEDGSTISDDYGCYDVTDERSIIYTHAFEAGTTEEYNPSSDYLPSVDYVPSSDCDDYIFKRSESAINRRVEQKIRFEIENDMIDLKNSLRIYISYKKALDGIHLYFNYFNYINTPFMKIEDNKFYPEIIDGTYLHLSPDQCGTLDLKV